MSNKPSAAVSRKKTFLLTETAMLIALLAVMGFTRIGMLPLGPMEITLLLIPVIVGAISGGIFVSTILGLTFGLISYIQCFTVNPFGMILFEESPFKCFLVCVVTRVLVGFLSGLIYKACAKHDKKGSWSMVVTSAATSLLNTVLFLGAMALLFGSHVFTPEEAAAIGSTDVLHFVIMASVSVNAPVELLVNVILGSAIGKAVHTAQKRIVK